MALKKNPITAAGKAVTTLPAISGPVSVSSKREAIAALEEMEAIGDLIAPYMDRQVELKKATTAYCAIKKIDKLPVNDHHYSLVTRHSRAWNPAKLKSLTRDVKVGGKSLWMKVTRRVPDAELIDRAVKHGWISEKKISKAFEETPQQPFLQRYQGRVE